jgi:medium-chain acyl-[acyl-carrier-protein] hydrolase
MLLTLRSPVSLVCFHHAGGSAASFNSWHRRFTAGSGVSILKAQLPGRFGTGLNYPTRDLADIVPELWQQLKPKIGGRYALYGHSLGALVAFEFARYAQAIGDDPPLLLFVSGRRAPHLPLKLAALSDKPDPVLIDHVKDFGGTPGKLLNDPRWRDFYLPTLRADLRISDYYQWDGGPPVSCPISVFRGRNDPIVAEDELMGWRRHTARAFSFETLPGGHFFTAEGLNDLALTIAAELGCCDEEGAVTPILALPPASDNFCPKWEGGIGQE